MKNHKIMDNNATLEKQLSIETFKERLKKREIWINGKIDDSLVEKLYINFIKLQEQSREDIKIIINSNGGNYYESAVATDIIGTSPNLVKTIALGKAVSGGFIIFMAGHERICHDYTYLMMHSAAFSTFNKVGAIRDEVEQVEYSLQKQANFLSAQTNGKTTPSYWIELFKSQKDKWFSIEEALELGIVHKIIKRRGINIMPRKPFTWDLKLFNNANQV